MFFDVYVVFCDKNELFYFCLVKCIKKKDWGFKIICACSRFYRNYFNTMYQPGQN